VPRQVASGRGWSWVAANDEVEVTGNGASLANLAIAGTLDIMASHVTVDDVKVTSGSSFGVSLRHTAGVTIENSTITGQNTAAGRVSAAICDVYGDSSGMVIRNDNISYFKTAIQVTTGRITGNYIHNPGYVPGDHTNGILDAGTTQPLTITHNTILISLGQTDAISLDATGSSQRVANKVIRDNLLGGGSYTIYGGTSHGNATSHITISGNVFSQEFFPSSGQFGAAAYFSPQGAGNTWARNTWDTTGQDIGFGSSVAMPCAAPACTPGSGRPGAGHAA
jgi:Right handed beta helix region